MSASSSQPLPLSVEYFEHIAQEPGHKALCLPLHYGTLEVLIEFICKHWQRGFVIAFKTMKQAEYIKRGLETCISSDRSIHIELLQAYHLSLERSLQYHPIIVTTHSILLQYPPNSFYYILNDRDTDQLKAREFAIIVERYFMQEIRLSESDYYLLNALTNSTDNIEGAQQSIQEKLNSDNELTRETASFLLTQLLYPHERLNQLTPFTIDRALYRLGVVIEQRKNGILSRHHNDYIASLHCGQLANRHVWIIDGTGDLHQQFFSQV